MICSASGPLMLFGLELGVGFTAVRKRFIQAKTRGKWEGEICWGSRAPGMLVSQTKGQMASMSDRDGEGVLRSQVRLSERMEVSRREKAAFMSAVASGRVRSMEDLVQGRPVICSRSEMKVGSLRVGMVVGISWLERMKMGPSMIHLERRRWIVRCSGEVAEMEGWAGEGGKRRSKARMMARVSR